MGDFHLWLWVVLMECVCVCRGGGPGSRRERTMIPLLLGWGKSLDRKKEPQCIARIW